MRVVGATVCLMLLAAAPSLAAKRIPVSFHGLRTLGLQPEEEASFVRAIRETIAAAPRLTLAWSGDVTASCRRDAACHCRTAREHKAARALFGNIGRIGNIFTIELALVDTQSCAVEGSAFISETHDAASARARLVALVDKVTTPHEEVSETAVKDERDVASVPAIVSVYTAKQMRELGVQRFEELLRLVPGFEYLDANWGGIVLHHGLPGTILFLIDGVPLANPMQNFLYYARNFSVSLGSVERVEFVRGPGSVLWGPNAFLGMINIITRRPTEAAPRVTGQASYGTLNTIDLFASAEQRHRYFAYYLATSINFSRGPQTFVENSPLNPLNETPAWSLDSQHNKSGTTDNQMDYFWSVVLKVELVRRLQFLLHYGDTKDYYQISPYGSLLSPQTYGMWHHEQRIYGLSWEDRLPRGLRYRISASRYEYRDWENYVMHPPDPRGDPTGLRYLQGNEVEPQVTHLAEARLYHSFEARRWSSQLLVGLSYRHQQLPDTYAMGVPVTSEPDVFDLDLSRRSFQTVAAYVQEEIGLGRWLLLSGGASVEHWMRPEATETQPSFQGGIVLRTRLINAKLIYAEGFRPPEANSLYSSVGLKGNDKLDSERSRALSGEAELRWGPLVVRAGATRAWLTNLVVVKWNHKDGVNCSDDPNIFQCPFNGGSKNLVAAYGELRVEWPPLLRAFATYSYKWLSESDEGKIGNGVALAPHTASFGASVRPMHDLDIFATASLIGPRYVQAFAWNAPVNDHLIGTTFDFSVGAWLTNLFRGLDVGLTLHNPLGIVHQTPYDIDGNTARFIERRQVSEIMITLRWSSALEVGDLFRRTSPPAASLPAASHPSR
jgi:outer membrane cobalamin receptor